MQQPVAVSCKRRRCSRFVFENATDMLEVTTNDVPFRALCLLDLGMQQPARGIIGDAVKHRH